MPRRHGRNGAVYLAATSGAAASPVTFQAAWTVDVTADKTDVTTWADSQHVYVAELPDISGSFTGFLDDATSQTYVAASDGLPRAFCLYPDTVNSPAVYFAGTVIADFSGGGASAGPVTVAATWGAEAGVRRYPLPGLLDETATAEITDEGGGIILNEDGS